MALFELERNANFEQLIRHLEASSNPDIRRRAAEILGSLETSADDVVTEGQPRSVRDDVVDALITASQEDEDDEVRAAAIDALDQYGQDALEEFIGELSGQDFENLAEWKKAKVLARGLSADRAELRMAAATGLGRIGEDNVVKALVNRLDDPDARVRKRVARALGRIESAGSVPALAKRFHADTYAVRIEIAYALADIGTDNALRELIDVADAEDEVLRRIAVDALGRLGSTEAVEVLANALSDETDMVRRTAMFSLVQLLSEAPSNASHQVREKIVGELEVADTDEVIDPLIEILDRSTETAQRRNAAWLLGRVANDNEGHTEDAQDALIETMGDDDEMTSKFAATSLSMLDSDGLELRLLELVEDGLKDEELRVKALFVLGKIGTDTSRRRLSSFVERTDSDRLRKRGFSALSKLGGVGTVAGDPV